MRRRIVGPGPVEKKDTRYARERSSFLSAQNICHGAVLTAGAGALSQHLLVSATRMLIRMISIEARARSESGLDGAGMLLSPNILLV